MKKIIVGGIVALFALWLLVLNSRPDRERATAVSVGDPALSRIRQVTVDPNAAIARRTPSTAHVQSAPGAPGLPVAKHPSIVAALHDEIPAMMPRLRACYRRGAVPGVIDPWITLEVVLWLTPDRDIGTAIEAAILKDPAQELTGTFVQCVRDELETIALPALPPGSETEEIRLPFELGPS